MNKVASQEQIMLCKQAAMNRFMEYGVDEKTASDLFDALIVKLAGIDQRGVRDGTGPFRLSAVRAVSPVGVRQMSGVVCPVKKEDDKSEDSKKKDKKDSAKSKKDDKEKGK